MDAGQLMANKKLVQWEYVISALSHTDLDTTSIYERPDIVAKFNDMLESCQDRYNHKISLLFNAFTEKSQGYKLKMLTSAYNIHADSGGLQVVTLGSKIDDKMRNKIYKVQSEYSHVAMSFDEMPVVVQQRSGKLDTNDRRFDSTNFEALSRQSGKNLLEQIDFFLAEKTKAKPLVILHGNDMGWYQKNLDFILDEIPESKWKYIDGISCGSGAMGFGDLENIERAAVMAFIEAPEHLKKKFHVLGVGALSRMTPLVALLRNGVFNDDVHISYDSSSLTIGFTMGFYHMDNHWCKKKIDRQIDETFMEMLEDATTKSKKYWNIDIDRDDVFSMFCKLAADCTRDPGPEKYIVNMAVLLNSVMNFNYLLDRLTTDDVFYNNYIEKDAQTQNYKSLALIKSKSDFDYWKRNYGRFFGSNRVEDIAQAQASLSDFF